MEQQKFKHLPERNTKNCDGISQKNGDRFNCRAPFVFSIPRMYEDDYERNDGWYLRLQKIEKKAKELKDEMLSITQRHLHRYTTTRRMIEASLERCNKLIYKPSNEEMDLMQS